MNLISLFIAHILLLKLITFYLQGPALEATLQELAYLKTGRECGDGPDVKGRSLLNLEPIRMPEAGMISIKHIIGCLFSTVVYF